MALRIIAEVGVNHNGDLAVARRMVRVAAECGADIVKFQAFTAAKIATGTAGAAAYQRRNAGAETQMEMLRNLELSADDFAVLATDCRNAGVEFLATPFDMDMLPHLIALGMRIVKVASGELTNTPALRQIGATGLPVLLSTGMATLDEVAEAAGVLRAAGSGEVTLLHCTSLYPAPPEAINLTAMTTMRDRLGGPIGYSDHSLGDHIAIAAVALGACVIEKHFTLDRTLPGPDHRASLEPDEFRTMVVRLRETAAALGDGVKRPHPSELDTRQLVRRSWHAARPLAAGAILQADDLVLKRPLGGMAPSAELVGRRLARAVAADMPLTDADFL